MYTRAQSCLQGDGDDDDEDEAGEGSNHAQQVKVSCCASVFSILFLNMPLPEFDDIN